MRVSSYKAFSFTLLVFLFGQVLFRKNFLGIVHITFSHFGFLQLSPLFQLSPICCDSALVNFFWWIYFRELSKIPHLTCSCDKQALNFQFLDIDIRSGLYFTHVRSLYLVFRLWCFYIFKSSLFSNFWISIKVCKPFFTHIFSIDNKSIIFSSVQIKRYNQLVDVWFSLEIGYT